MINLNVKHVYNHQMLEIHRMQQNTKMIIKGSMFETRKGLLFVKLKIRGRKPV